MSQHTRGPWRAKEGMVYAENGSGETIANIGNNNNSNAQLIAAAPDLLAACKVALTEYHPTAREGDPVAEQLMMAIAKAEGEER